MTITDYTRADYDLIRNLYEFKALVAMAGVSSNAGAINTSTRYIRTTQLFTRMTISGFSFLCLLPGSSLAKTHDEFWDWPSIASIARNIVETYHLFWYLADPALSEKEVCMRIDLMRFHLNCEKFKLYKEQGAPEEVLREFEEGLPKDRAALAADPVFVALPKELRSRLLKGKTPMHLTHAQIAERLSFLNGQFRPMYRLFSNQVHSTPFSFQSQSNDRGRGFENDAERFYIIIAIKAVIKYFTTAVIEMGRIFPEQIGRTCSGLIELAKMAHDEA